MTEIKKGEITNLLVAVREGISSTKTLTEEEANAFILLEKTIAEITTEG